MNCKKIYIAGQVTGLDYAQTFKKFADAEHHLDWLGYETINPMREVPKEANWKDAMKTCIVKLMECDSIYLLDDHVHSKGAMMEKNIAMQLEMEIFNQGQKMPHNFINNSIL